MANQKYHFFFFLNTVVAPFIWGYTTRKTLQIKQEIMPRHISRWGKKKKEKKRKEKKRKNVSDVIITMSSGQERVKPH